MNLKQQLKLYMENNGLTLSELSRKAAVPKSSLSDWLNGSKPRDLEQVKRVATVFKTSLDHLCFGAGINREDQKITELDALIGDQWISGLFEVRFRRVKK